MKKHDLKVYFLLHLMLMVYSMSGIFSKHASQEKFLSPKFCIYYAGVIVILGLYAIAWQQIIKRLPLTSAYANRAVTVIWGLIWGVLFFHEQVDLGKIIGVLLIVGGIVIFSRADHKEETI